jgi:esterase/lipase
MKRFNIPIIELLSDHPKGLFILMHGHFGNKSLNQFGGLAEQIHDLGFDVVTLDAYKHGERLEAPYILNNPRETTYEMVSVIEETLKDIVYLYTHHYSKRTQHVSILGISMGGHIAFLLNRLLQLEFCIPIIGSPDLYKHYEMKKSAILGETMNEIVPKLKSLTLDAKAFTPSHAFILNGEYDDVVSFEPAKSFIQPLNHENYVYQGYPCGHELTQAMIEDIISFVRSRL